MSVKKEASGRRSVQVEVEVPGTPEEVWQAIATGPGISSWFVPTEFEERDGKPVAVKLNFGPGMETSSVVTAWDPPRRFAAEAPGWVPGSPPIADEWSVEARGGGICVVRIVHSLFASTDDWDNQLEGTESGWPGFFRILKIYLTHFRGQRSAMMQWLAPALGTEADLGNADRGIGAERRERGATLGGSSERPGGRPGAQRRGGARQPESVQRAAAARQAGDGHRRAWRRELRRPEHGHAKLLPLRRSSGRDRCPRDTALASVDSRTLPGAVGGEQE
jgi:uncharacterized protein YndB with AHSA1/START domain